MTLKFNSHTLPQVVSIKILIIADTLLDKRFDFAGYTMTKN